MPSELNPDRKLVSGRWIRWDETRAARAYAEGRWIHQTLADALQQAADQTPRRVLLVDGTQRIDCQTLHAQATRLAQALLARAPGGSVVSFLLPNWHEAAVIYLAATLAGMVVNPILPSLRDRELQFILKDVNSRLVFVPASFRQQDYAAMLGRVAAQIENPPEVVVLRGDPGPHTAYDSLLRQEPPATAFPARDPDAVRMVLYTSGTTGRPKGVLHTHNSLHALIRQVGEHWRVEPGDRFLVPSPIGHIGGSIYAFESPLLLGTTAVLMERWDADEAVQIMQAEGCSHMAGATPFLEQLLAASRRAGTRLPSLKVFVCGGASVPPSLIRDAADYFERAVVTRVYGSTEVPITTVGATRPEETRQAADTDGRAGFAEITLLNHGSAPAGEGEIHARGPQMLVGYLHPEDEAGSFDAQGYFRTGDLARFDDDRYLVVTGRAKDIIIRNGENISPKEVEDILIGHPQIAEIAIVGLPDARTGERACAVIVPPKGAPGPDVASLRSFLNAQGVALFKAPEQVLLLEALPKNDAGKVLKHQLRASLLQPA
ncbi:cyclohexanecarboxylate-CoA ligase [Solimonas sp. K1W22B-7]|uniref:AMP-binding protein n=1 Tax=Solimonas sp. K1W22B-7 TaxID=2303331 RepID=UPI000E333942|nr:AMP-binding protein [Solimonas sp. K1W22B-7]AXQ28560.1 cyclohexanecarboxylate-CoA ligase [Solimonas sp. K1W22B-7]